MIMIQSFYDVDHKYQFGNSTARLTVGLLEYYRHTYYKPKDNNNSRPMNHTYAIQCVIIMR
jgi:hypothetical protein